MATCLILVLIETNKIKVFLPVPFKKHKNCTTNGEVVKSIQSIHGGRLVRKMIKRAVRCVTFHK